MEHAVVVIILILIISYLLCEKKIKWADPISTYNMNMSVKYLLEKGPMYPSEEGYALMETIKDPLGVELLEKLRKKHKHVCKVWVAGKVCYVILDHNMIMYILDHSPEIFGPGIFKKNYFTPFMPDNVGVNDYSRWITHRPFNQDVLATGQRGARVHELVVGKLETYVFDFIKNIIVTGKDFIALGTRAAQGINFGERYNTPEDTANIVNMFIEAQSNPWSTMGVDPISESTHRRYKKFVGDVIALPPEDSLVHMAVQLKNSGHPDVTIIDQIPHWFFPIRNIIGITVPTFFIVIDAFPDAYSKISAEIENGLNIYSTKTYFHYVAQEIFRMYGIVTTIMRTATRDVEIPAGDTSYKFKKGSQLVLTASMLTRSERCFPDHNVFNPDRWATESAAKEDGPCDIVFSAGTQKCPGKDLGLIIFKKVVNDIIKMCEFEVMEPTINRDNLPHFINPFKLKLGLKRRAIDNFGYEAFAT